MRIDFYHLSARPIEQVLPSICEKLLAAGERLLIVARGDLLAGLDRALWTYDPAGFLPHGRAGGERAEAQPILLSESPEPLNGARNIALADGEWRNEALGFDRAFYFFDASTIDDARASWRALNGKDGAELHYWKQEGGRWIEGP